MERESRNDQLESESETIISYRRLKSESETMTSHKKTRKELR